MKLLQSTVLAASLGCALAGLQAASPADEAIAKARAFVGTEAALDAVQTIHFVGVLELEDKAPAATAGKASSADTKVSVPVDIMFKKPMQQRVTAKSTAVLETTALDGYDAWQRKQDLADASKWQLALLDKDQIRRLQANTWENLYFFKGIEKQGGRIDYQGDSKVDGRDCVKLAYVHPSNVVFIRYFDKQTGQLLLTETETGATIREEGSLVVKGVRFPKRVVNTSSDGKKTSISFESVTVNEAISDEEFAVPSLATVSTQAPSKTAPAAR